MTPEECAEIHAIVAEAAYRLYGDAGTPVFKRSRETLGNGRSEVKVAVTYPLMARIGLGAKEREGDG